MYSIQRPRKEPINEAFPVQVVEVDPAWVQRVLATVQAGFPSPAEDHVIERIDLNKVLIKHPLSTFLMRVRGGSMREAGIDDGDVVLIDRYIPQMGDDEGQTAKVGNRRKSREAAPIRLCELTLLGQPNGNATYV